MLADDSAKHVNEVIYLIAVGGEPASYNLLFYDMDTAAEVQILLNSASQGYAPVTLNNAWGAALPMTFSQPGLQVLERLRS